MLVVFTADRRLSPFLAVNFVLEAYGERSRTEHLEKIPGEENIHSSSLLFLRLNKQTTTTTNKNPTDFNSISHL